MRVTASRRRRRWVLEIPEAADLAAEAADVDRTTWEMARADCERLADTLDWLLAELPGELTFEVVRSDAAAAMEVVASRVELASAARRGAIGTRTRYRVLV